MKIGRRSGSSRSLPIGWRASAMMPALLASRMNFIHSSVRICSLKVASKPAFRHSARKSSALLLSLPSSSPNIMRMKLPTCWITPGAMIEGTDLRHAAHHGVLAQDRDQPFGGIDAVLHGDDGGA